MANVSTAKGSYTFNFSNVEKVTPSKSHNVDSQIYARIRITRICYHL